MGRKYTDPKRQQELHNIRSKVWADKNPDKRREMYLLYTHDINLDQYNTLFNAQAGCCFICGRNQLEIKKKLAVDHCHTTGKIRGLLCTNCNTFLGYYEKNRDRIMEYLK